MQAASDRAKETAMRAAAFALLVLPLACAKSAPARQAAPGVYEVFVTAAGFEPARIEVPHGEAVTLRITRKVDSTCADAVDVQGDPVRHMLPLNSPVDVRIAPIAGGEIAFACPMKMYKGAVVATAGR